MSRGELTSESEETTRINRATKRTQRWAQQDQGQDQGTSGSDVDHTMGEVGTTSSSMPKTIGVFDYADWLLSKLSEEQRKQNKKNKTSFHSLSAIWISALGWAQP